MTFRVLSEDVVQEWRTFAFREIHTDAEVHPLKVMTPAASWQPSRLYLAERICCESLQRYQQPLRFLPVQEKGLQQGQLVQHIIKGSP